MAPPYCNAKGSSSHLPPPPTAFLFLLLFLIWSAFRSATRRSQNPTAWKLGRRRGKKEEKKAALFFFRRPLLRWNPPPRFSLSSEGRVWKNPFLLRLDEVGLPNCSCFFARRRRRREKNQVRGEEEGTFCSRFKLEKKERKERASPTHRKQLFRQLRRGMKKEWSWEGRGKNVWRCVNLKQHGVGRLPITNKKFPSMIS